jgi:hypothetical protein
MDTDEDNGAAGQSTTSVCRYCKIMNKQQSKEQQQRTITAQEQFSSFSSILLHFFSPAVSLLHFPSKRQIFISVMVKARWQEVKAARAAGTGTWT